MSKLRVTSRQIEAFIGVVECNSFTGAAQRLSLTNSAVSNLIAELETSIGTRLFERSTRRVMLNDAGRRLLPAALGFYRNLRQVEQIAETLGVEADREVRIAAPLVIASVILPPIIAAFQTATPGVEITIVDTGVEWLADRVSTGEVDLAIGPDRATEESVDSENLLPSRWVVWLSPDHPLAALPVLRWRDLKDSTFIAAGHDHERIVEQAMAGLPPEERIIPGHVHSNITTALGLAAANLGVCLCPAYVEPLASAFRLEMRRVIDPEFTRYVVLYKSVARPLSEAGKRFADMLRDHFVGLAAAQDS